MQQTVAADEQVESVEAVHHSFPVPGAEINGIQGRREPSRLFDPVLTHRGRGDNERRAVLRALQRNG